jgi:DNA repair exonuclease SbcCD ATPase subunit
VHTVTKVLVVFAAVLCVLLAALTMAYSVNVNRVSDDYLAAKDAKAQADTSASIAIAQVAELQQQKQQEIDALRNTLLATETKIRDLQSENTQLITSVRSAESARDAIANQTGQIVASNNTLAEINKAYANEVGKLRETELARSRREIELVDRINDLESQVEVQVASVRALQEQLAEARRTIDSGGSIRTTGKTNQPYQPSIAIQGKVVNVGKDPATQKPMATINIGTNDNVRENMELVVTRNGEFVANLIVTKTDLQWSMGRIDALGRNVKIQAGDVVTTLASR